MWRVIILIFIGAGCGDELSRVMLKDSAQDATVYIANPAPMDALDLGSHAPDALADVGSEGELDATLMTSDGPQTAADLGGEQHGDQAVSDQGHSAVTQSDASAD